MEYGIEDLFNSINDIYYQLDEGKMELTLANELTNNCCKAFMENYGRLKNDNKK